MKIIPEFKSCSNPKCNGEARLQKAVYHFLNTKEPYMLRHCPKCDTWYLVLVDKN
jgi:hypothetical protein